MGPQPGGIPTVPNSMYRYGPNISIHSLTLSQSSFAGSIFYSWTSFATKAALLLLSARVFAQFRKIVIFIWGAIAIQALFCIAITVVKICLCVPVPAIWEGPDAYPGVKCINRQASFIADTAFAAVADLVIFVPPLILTWSLSFTCKLAPWRDCDGTGAPVLYGNT